MNNEGGVSYSNGGLTNNENSKNSSISKQTKTVSNCSLKDLPLTYEQINNAVAKCV